MQKLQNLKKQTIDITENGETKYYYIGKNRDSYTNQLRFVINKADLKHDIIIKAVLWDESQFDLEAILIVNTGAKNSDTYLKIDCLLMSEKTGARVIPSLEITEDAVKSGHGATVSSLNETQIEYLMSRGLGKKQAEKLIIEGFLK